jgi:hypothetical protein
MSSAPPAAADRRRAPTSEGDRRRAPTSEGDREAGPPALDLDLAPPGTDLSSAYQSLELDLPPLPPVRGSEELSARDTRPSGPPSELAGLPGPRPTGPGSTRPMPQKTRPPAFDPISGLSGTAAAAPAPPVRAPTDPTDERPTRDLTLEPTEPALKSAATAAPTQELPYVLKLDPRLAEHPDPLQPLATTLDFAEKPTNQLAPRALSPKLPEDLVSAQTRDLGLRAEPAPTRDRRAATEDETTGVDVFRARTPRANGKHDIPGMDPIDARSTEILEQVDRGAPAVETREERTRRRITALLDRAAAWSRDSDFDRAVTAVDLALSEDPNSALAQKLIHRNRDAIMNAFQAYLGDLQRTPSLARPLHELGSAPISPRAAFLLSRVDGTLSLDEILDVSGMPRLEAYRYLCQLFLRGILR